MSVMYGGGADWPNKDAVAGDPRGVKNNNPGNLRIGESGWRGKRPAGQNTDGEFEQFDTMLNGARANMKNMRTWYNRGKNTIESLISTLSPKTENDTENYIRFLAREMSMGRAVVFPWKKEVIAEMAYHISRMENGTHKLITKDVFHEAFDKL